jgi:hypothetical protein
LMLPSSSAPNLPVPSEPIRRCWSTINPYLLVAIYDFFSFFFFFSFRIGFRFSKFNSLKGFKLLMYFMMKVNGMSLPICAMRWSFKI